MEYGVVLKGGGNDMLFPMLRPRFCHSENGQIIRLTAAGGKDDFLRLTAQLCGDPLPCVPQGHGGFLPLRVQTGGIPIDLHHMGQHFLDCRLAQFCGCGVIRIYVHNVSFVAVIPAPQ
jgi:hypothetical protein